jgi:hypothetical protein
MDEKTPIEEILKRKCSCGGVLKVTKSPDGSRRLVVVCDKCSNPNLE